MDSVLSYIAIDLEVDGPTPGQNSMMSLGAVSSMSIDKHESSFFANLDPLEGATGDADTLAWWAKHPDAFARSRENAISPKQAISDFAKWVQSIPGDKILIAHPLMLDGVWLDYYLDKFAKLRVCRGPFKGDHLFFGAGIDLPSFAMAALNMDYRRCRREFYPAEVVGTTEHNHTALDDARGHLETFLLIAKRAAINI